MFDFLNNIQISENKKTERVYTSTELNPSNGADIRLFKDGRVYPSEALVAEYNLEYNSKDEPVGNGFDVFPSTKWGNYPKDVDQVIFIAAVPKDKAKVNLFASTKYQEDGTPTASVLEQGAATFGKELVQMLADVYKNGSREELFGEAKYVDLVIVRDVAVKTPDNIYLIPKTVSRGVDQGKPTTERRENIVLNPLGIFMPEATTGEDELAKEESTTTDFNGEILAAVETQQVNDSVEA